MSSKPPILRIMNFWPHCAVTDKKQCLVVACGYRERSPIALIYFLGKQRRSLRTTKILTLSENLRSWHRQHKLYRAILITSSCCFYFEFGASTVLSSQASFPVWRNLKNVCHCICAPWEACLGLGSLCYSSNYDKTDYISHFAIHPNN